MRRLFSGQMLMQNVAYEPLEIYKKRRKVVEKILFAVVVINLAVGSSLRTANGELPSFDADPGRFLIAALLVLSAASLAVIWLYYAYQGGWFQGRGHGNMSYAKTVALITILFVIFVAAVVLIGQAVNPTG